MVPDFLKLAMSIGEALQKKSWKLSVAESCTGGWLAQVVTSIAGSSQWFDCGFIVYSNESKIKLLQVQQKTLEQFGAVSEDAAKEMAQGALRNASAHISLAITGIAGPGGGTDEKPIGTVCFAIYLKNGTVITHTHHFSGNREQIRKQSVVYALQLLLTQLTNIG